MRQICSYVQPGTGHRPGVLFHLRQILLYCLVGSMRGRGGVLISCAADAHSHSMEGCVKEKQCLHLETLVLPAKARFHSVGSRLAHIFVEFAAALKRNLRSYPIQLSPSYCIEASIIKDWYPSRLGTLSGCFRAIMAI